MSLIIFMQYPMKALRHHETLLSTNLACPMALMHINKPYANALDKNLHDFLILSHAIAVIQTNLF
jgi:hypothetical protein